MGSKSETIQGSKSVGVIQGRSPRQIAWMRFKRNKVGVTAAEADVAPATMTALTARALAAVTTTARRRAEILLIDAFPFIKGAQT